MKEENALSGNAKLVGAAAGAAGVVNTTFLLPLNTLQTVMQAGEGKKTLGLALRGIFQDGAISGALKLYRAWPPTMMMVGMRHSLIFGMGAGLKRQLPMSWPEPARDAASMAASGLVFTSILYPMDTVKTNLQLGKPLPRLDQLYQGFCPAVSHTVIGRALWIAARNKLEASVPTPGDPRLASWKHFVCGGVTGGGVTFCVFPFDTLKKRLQAADRKAHLNSAMASEARNIGMGCSAMALEARNLLREGGVPRFYRGVSLKISQSVMQGACFNLAFVLCKRLFDQSGAFSEPPVRIRDSSLVTR